MSLDLRIAATRVATVGLAMVLLTSGRTSATGLTGSAFAKLAPAFLQSGHNLEKPPTWKARYDAGGAGERSYLVMRPGWHINPGPAGIFWDPGRFATGNYSVTSTIFLFPPGQGEPPSQVEAAFGLLLAGKNLGGARPSYVTFLLRNDGSFRVAHHAGEETHEIVPWTRHEAVVTWSEDTVGTSKNVLVVDATGESVTFWVNDQQVTSVPRADLVLAGVVGVRAGEGLSLHISEIVIGANPQ